MLSGGNTDDRATGSSGITDEARLVGRPEAPKARSAKLIASPSEGGLDRTTIKISGTRSADALRTHVSQVSELEVANVGLAGGGGAIPQITLG